MIHTNAVLQGEDPLEPFGVYDTRTAQQIYDGDAAADGKEADADAENPVEVKDALHPLNQWWKQAVKQGQRKPQGAHEEEPV